MRPGLVQEKPLRRLSTGHTATESPFFFVSREDTGLRDTLSPSNEPSFAGGSGRALNRPQRNEPLRFEGDEIGIIATKVASIVPAAREKHWSSK